MNCSSATMNSIIESRVYRLFCVVVLFIICIPREAHTRANRRRIKLQRQQASANRLSVPTFTNPESCPINGTHPGCDSTTPYRTFDGSCNNLINPAWGQSRRPQLRLISAQYNRGSNNDMRTRGIKNKLLPSTRKVSTTIHKLATEQDLSRRYTTMHMLWGQFLAHDLSHVLQVDKVECCPGGLWKKRNRNKKCIPIFVPRFDPFWGWKARSKGSRRTCMEMRRAEAIEPGQCSNTEREQINDLTSYIDASMVYGSDAEKAASLRAFSGGLLKSSNDGSLPLASSNTQCDIPETDSDKKCFFAGDKRLHEWAGLTSTHEIFMREHNRIAAILYGQVQARNPYLPESSIDEITFQETRRIIAALVQVITYGEYLPLVIGQAEMQKYGLHLQSKSHDFRSSYDSSVNPTVSNVFSVAAFRFGHGTIPFGSQPVTSKFMNCSSFVSMHDMFNQPSRYRSEGFDNTIRGTVRGPMLEQKGKFVQDIRDKTHAKTFGGVGFDLPAKNTQRSREQGIPPYMQWRKFCNLPQSLSNHEQSKRIQLQKLYKSNQDIDLFPAAMTERIVSPEAAVGPTFACLIGREFQRLKKGDRFWFENQYSYADPFTPQQITQLSQVTLSKLICENLLDTQRVPLSSFLLSSRLVDCSTLPGLDLNNWII